MAGSSFAGLLAGAYVQVRENRRLLLVTAGVMLLSFLVMLPVIAISVVFAVQELQPPGAEPLVLSFGAQSVISLAGWVFGLLILWFQVGLFREFMLPAPANFGRALRSGFRRWRVGLAIWVLWLLLLPLSWLLLLLPSPVQIAGSFLLTLVTMLVYPLLEAAAAAGAPGQAVGDVFRRGFAALANGWGRAILVILALSLAFLGAEMLFVLTGVGMAVLARLHWLAGLLGILLAAAAAIALILFGLWLWALFCGFLARLYLETTGNEVVPEP